MDHGPHAKIIVEAFDGMPAQLQAAARYVLDHPRDVALLSMREQARRAGVKPATMTRLAKHLGMEGYEALRERYADAVRGGELGFADRAGAQVLSQKLHGDKALAAELIKSLDRHFAAMTTPAMVDLLAETAKSLAGARRIYCLGLRSSYGAAWHFSYILSLFGAQCILLDGMGGVGPDMLRGATSADAMLVVSVSPYTRATLEIAAYAAHRGVPLVAITDSEVAPLAQMARHAIFVPIDSPSFFHTMAPAYAVAEMLAVLVAGRGGEAALEALRQADQQMAELNTHFIQRPGTRSP